MKRILAVYDSDEVYAERFVREVNRKTHIPFEAVAFQSMDGLAKFAKSHKVEVLMVDSGTDRRAVREIGAEKTVFIADGRSAAGDEDVFCIYKYQSSANIIREVLNRYSDGEKYPPREGVRIMARIYGVFSPVGKCGKTSLAVTLGHVLAEEQPTLLLNLEEFSGFRVLSGEEYEGDLSDLLYYSSSGGYSSSRLAAIVHTMNGLDYVPPVHFPEDLDFSRADALPGLIRKIAAESAYRNIVIDVGKTRKMTVPILECCNVIFMPERRDAVSQAKIAEFDRYLAESGNRQVAEKIRKITIPRVKCSGGQGYFDYLLWNGMGKFARGLLLENR